MADWEKKFIDLANHISTWSKDRKKKVGAVIVNEDNRVVSVGYNWLPSGVKENIPERHIKPLKLSYFVHAEANAIYSAARIGTKIEGCSMYITFHPCAICAQGIIQSGIKRVICYTVDFENDSWGPTSKIAKELFEESGVEIIYLENEKI